MASALLSRLASAQAQVIVPFGTDTGGVNYPAGRIDSSFWLPVESGCLVKMLPVWDSRDGRQEDEATECGKQARGDGGGSGALSGQRTEREGEHTQRIHPGDRLSPQACDSRAKPADRQARDGNERHTSRPGLRPGRTAGADRGVGSSGQDLRQEAEVDHSGTCRLDGAVWAFAIGIRRSGNVC